MEQFANLYQVIKTLRFELKPKLLEGQTVDDFWKTYLSGPEEDELHKLFKFRKFLTCQF